LRLRPNNGRFYASLLKTELETIMLDAPGAATLPREINGIPRRIRIDHFTPAEAAIHAAMHEVEKAGGSIALTEAINLLSKARDRVADHFEGIG
jgi:hypothetical protein